MDVGLSISNEITITVSNNNKNQKIKGKRMNAQKNKIIILMLTILFLSIQLFSAEFKVKSFTPDQSDLTAIQQKVTDDNGDRTGILKIQSDQTSGMMVFANLGVVKIDKSHPGEFWIYLSSGEKRVKISKDGFLPLDYVLPNRIESDKVYVLTLKTTGLIGGNSTIDEGLHKIIFKFNETSVYAAKGNSAPVMVNGKTAAFKLPEGEEVNFSFIKSGFEDYKTTIKVDEDKILDINLIAGSSTTKLKMPGVIVINSDPIEAEIYLNDQKYSATPFADQLIAGNYNLSIRKNLYYTHNTSFIIEEGETKELPIIKLKPKFGYYAISTTPNKAKIYLDGVLFGTSPLERTKIESGDHIFKAEYDLYHTEEKEITFIDGDDKNINFDLKQNFGELKINSEPSGAIIYLNNKKVGITPFLKTKFQSGKYKVRLTKPFWSDIDETLIVNDAEKTEKMFVLNKNFGVVTVKTVEDADLFINNKKVGTSFYEKNMKPGRYTIIAKKFNHKDAEKEIFVNIGRTQEIELKPEPIMGSISIFSTPHQSKGAEIFLNSKNSGKKTPAVIPLLIGNYEVSLKHSDFLEMSKQISLKKGENRRLDFEMQTYEGSRKSNRDFWATQKWIALGSFVATVGTGGYFYSAGNGYYDDYGNATNSAKAESLFKDAENADSYRDISFTVSLVPLGYFVYSWYKESSYK